MQEPLWHDSLQDALRDILTAVYKKGWAQKAAADMYPTEDPTAKGSWLQHALEKGRPEKPSIDDIIWIMRLGHKHGLHGAMYFLSDEIGYSRPAAIQPEDQYDELTKQFIAAAESIESTVKRMEKIKQDALDIPAFLRRQAG